MARSIDVKSVAVLSSKGEEIGAASGKDAIRLLVRNFIKKGEGKILVLLSPTGERVSLAMSQGGDLQIEYPQ